jgi:hypothetical protein
VAEVYMNKYGWPVIVRDGAFYADGAPTAGPPPYGFPWDEMFLPTRWRF